MKSLQYILVFFVSVFTSGQVSLVADTDKKVYNVNESIVLTIVQEVNGTNYVQETQLRSPDLSKFTIAEQGSLRNTFVEPPSTHIEQLIYEIILKPKHTGKLKIGSFLVTLNGVIYKTEPFDIFVKNGEMGRKSSSETFLSVELADSEIYENQSTTAIFKVYSKDYNNLRKVGKVSFADNVHQLHIKPIGFEKSKIEQTPDGELFFKVVEKAIITPKEAGEYSLPQAWASYNDEARKISQLKCNSAQLNVKKLPSSSPANFKNAVGKFVITLSSDHSGEVLEVGKSTYITLKIKGEGDLKASLLPKLSANDGLDIFTPEITEHIYGTRGEIIARYLIVPRRTGAFTIETEGFSFFNPETQSYVNLGQKTINIEAKTTEQINAEKSTLDRVNEYTAAVLKPIDTIANNSQKASLKDKNPINWTFVAVGIFIVLSFVMVLIIIVFKSKNKKLPAKSLGTISETEATLRKELALKLTTDFSYLKTLIAESRFEEFFKVFDMEISQFEEYCSAKYQLTGKEYFAQNSGQQFAEDYRLLTEKIRIEKYAPHHSSETLAEIVDGLEQLFSHIA